MPCKAMISYDLKRIIIILYVLILHKKFIITISIFNNANFNLIKTKELEHFIDTDNNYLDHFKK